MKRDKLSSVETTMTSRIRRFETLVSDQMNFFRVHLLLFIIVPLLFSVLFYWLNDARTTSQTFVSFIDCLFLCVSAGTVAGLFTVDLSSLNVGQQIILAFLTAAGSYSFASTAMVVIRKHYFNKAVYTLHQKVGERQEEAKETVARSGAEISQKRDTEAGTEVVQIREELARGSNGASNSSKANYSRQHIGSNTLQPLTGRQIYSDTTTPSRGAFLRKRNLAIGTSVPVAPGVSFRRTDTAISHKDRGKRNVQYLPSQIYPLTLIYKVMAASHHFRL